MAGRVNDRVALLFGAARGIGGAIAERLAEEGARVVIVDRRAEAGQVLAARLGGSYLDGDVSREADVAAAVEQVLAEHGRLDICVQNAGIFPETLIEEISVAEWDEVLGVNLRGCFLAVRHALGPMKRQGYGRIVLTSSITGPRVVPPGHAHYAASKAGVVGLIRSAALESAAFGVTVNGVEPGNILTEGMKAERSAEFIAAMTASIPAGRMGEPRDVANAVLFLASEEAAFITGTTIVVDGGQLLPEGKS